jgi:dienelactone hydrolase
MKLPIGRVAVGGIFTAIFAFSAIARGDYADVGPEAITTTDLPASTDGGATGGSLVIPNGAGPYPLLVTTHGFSGTSANQLGWAQHFASYGFVVVVPSLPSTFSPKEDTDAAIIEGLAATYSAPPSESPAFGKVDGTKIGLEGHSAGGLATTMASSVINPAATVLFDPVDNGGVGVGDVPRVCSPLLEIFADPTSCNNDEGWDGAKAVSKGDQIQFHVVGASHCDGENAIQAGCTALCGASSTARQNEFASYATAFFLAYLKDDATAKSAISATALSADSAIASASVKAGSNCDGSTSIGADGGLIAVAEDGGSEPSSGSDAGDAATTTRTGSQNGAAPSSDSSGCTCTNVGSEGNGDRQTGYFSSAVAIGLWIAKRKIRVGRVPSGLKKTNR